MEKSTAKNLQDILKYAIKLENHEEKESIQIDEEKKQFLDCVLQTMSSNVMEEFLAAISILQNELSSNDDKCDALHLIRDYIDNIDFANSFVKLEGADILINCITSANKSVCVIALMAVAEMSQNNTFCQEYFLKYDIIELLIKILNHNDSEIVASSLYALSAIVRNYEPSLVKFIKMDGLKHVINCLDAKSSRVFCKACILITSISAEMSSIKDECAKLEVFSILVTKLKIVKDFDHETEITLRAMSVLLESPFWKPSESDKNYVGPLLKNVISQVGNLPECEEIVAFSNIILHALQGTYDLDHDK